jgi:rare lipoprotein A (peptidoglycan hydrolase)
MKRTVLAAALLLPVPVHADTGGADWLARAFQAPQTASGSAKGANKGLRARTVSTSVGDSGGGGESGVASYYWQPQRVASGGWFNPNAMTAAHKTLPFGSRVKVTHLSSGRSVTVVINDRGPFVKGRIIDLSRAAALSIGMTGAGVAAVRVERL